MTQIYGSIISADGTINKAIPLNAVMDIIPVRGGKLNKLNRIEIALTEPNYDDDEAGYAFANLSFYSPPGYEITADNWMHLLNYAVVTQDDKTLETILAPDVSKYIWLTTAPNIGQQYFHLVGTGSSPNKVILIENPDLDSHKDVVSSYKTLTLLKDPFINTDEEGHVNCGFNTQGIFVRLVTEGTSAPSQRIYELPFTRPITPDELIQLYYGKRQLYFKPDMLANILADDDDHHYLHVKTIGDFYYLESSDGKLKFTLDPQAVETALGVVNDLVSQHPNRMRQISWSSYFASQITKVDPAHLDATIINACIDFHEAYLKDG